MRLEFVGQRLSILLTLLVLSRLELELPHRYFQHLSGLVDELGDRAGVPLFPPVLLPALDLRLVVIGLLRLGFVLFDLFGEEVDCPE